MASPQQAAINTKDLRNVLTIDKNPRVGVKCNVCSKPVCRMFANRGSCSFGERCRYCHGHPNGYVKCRREDCPREQQHDGLCAFHWDEQVTQQQRMNATHRRLQSVWERTASQPVYDRAG